MHAEALVTGEYLKATVIANDTPTFTIRGASLEQLASLKPGAAEDKTVQKGVIWFNDSPQGWVMNQTNKICLVAMFGAETDAWRGKRVTLCTMPTKTGPGIRVKGSPDLDHPLDVAVKLPKRKVFTMTLVPTGPRRESTPAPAVAPMELGHLLGWLKAAVKDHGWTGDLLAVLLTEHGAPDGKPETLPAEKRRLVAGLVKAPPIAANPDEPPPGAGVKAWG